MFESKKKSVAGTAIPTAEKEKINTENIAHSAEKVKCVIQIPGKISEIVEIDKEFIKKWVIEKRVEKLLLPNGLILMMHRNRTTDPEPNIRFYDGCIVGTVAITAADDNESFRSLTVREIQTARAWLVKNTI